MIKLSLKEIEEKIKKQNILFYKNCSLLPYTWFQIGGKADFLCFAKDIDSIKRLHDFSNEYDIPLFNLGAGSNLLISDKGIRGLTIQFNYFNKIRFVKEGLIAQAGADIGSLCLHAFFHELKGLEFIYGLPGTVGGALYMNASCYGFAISDFLEYVDIINEKGNLERIFYKKEDFSYKKSPFQKRPITILEAKFNLKKGQKDKIWAFMQKQFQDRYHKNQYVFPNVGSIFKNDKLLSLPVGKIIANLGLKGSGKKGAQVSPWHGNVIINSKNAKACEVDSLIEHITCVVQKKAHVKLEREVLKVGEF